MHYLCSVPAEIALLGRWELDGGASLFGTLSLRKYAFLRANITSNETETTKEVGSDELWEHGLDNFCRADELAGYLRNNHTMSQALDRVVLAGNLESSDVQCRLFAMQHGGVWYSSRLNHQQPVPLNINRDMVVVRYEKMVSFGALQSTVESYLNEIALQFQPDGPIEHLGELLDQQHRVVSKFQSGSKAYTEFYNELKLHGAIGGRIIGNSVFLIVAPEKHSRFLMKVRQMKNTAVLPIEFSLRGAEFRAVE